MIDVMFALILSLMVEGKTQNIILNYSISPEECEEKVYRIKEILNKDKKITNIVQAKCVMLNVYVNNGTPS